MLTYHRVNDHRPQDRLSLSREAFARQLDLLLENGCQVMPLPAAVASLPQGEWPPRAVAITFDDGYADNFNYAWPELRQRNLPATIFLTADWIGQTDKTGPAPGCAAGDERDRALTWAEVRELQASGLIEIGSHTCSHPRLPRLDDAALVHELADSKAALEAKLGGAVRLLAYPAGAYDARVVSAALAAGYTAALTVRPGRNTAATPLLELRRTEVSALDRPVDSARKLTGAFDLLHRLAQSW